MNNQDHQTISLLVKDASIQLRDKTWLNTSGYRTTNQGIYILVDNPAKVFTGYPDEKNSGKKLCFVPFDKIEVIVYGASIEGSAANKQVPQSPHEKPQG